MADKYIFDVSFGYKAVPVPAGAEPDAGHDSVDQFIEKVFDHLVDDLHMTGVNVVLDTVLEQFTVSLSLDPDDDAAPDGGGEPEMVSWGFSAIRAAIHATGGPDAELDDPLRLTVVGVQLSAIRDRGRRRR